MAEPNLRAYCGVCGRKQMSSLDLHKDLENETAEIKIKQNVSMKDPREEGRTIRTFEVKSYIQKPALICEGCQQDRDNPIGDAAPIWVGGSKK